MLECVGMSDANNTTALTPADIAALSAYVFDLDGVIWRGSEPVEGAAEAVRRLREAGKRVLYCTNNSSKTQQSYAERLREMGLELEDEDVLTSSWATAVYLSAQFTGPYSAFVLGGEGIVSALQKGGARIVAEHDIDDDTRVDVVVVGMDKAFNYERLRLAQQLILRGAQFVATNRDATYPVENGVLPGSGAMVAAIESASGTTPVVIGKPRPAMLELAMERFGIKATDAAMVGDRLDTDIAAGRNAGMLALFVATGVTTPEQARKAKGDQRPHALFPNLSALCQIALDESLAPVKSETTAPETIEDETLEQDGAALTLPEEPAAIADESTAAPSSTPDGGGEDGGFNFSMDDAPQDAPSTASAEEAGEMAQELADAPIIAEPEPPAEVAPEAVASDEAAFDLSELEGIDWADTPEETNELATTATAAPENAEAAKSENVADPFSSWFEEADAKKE